MYDILLRNGTVIDPVQRLHARREVAIFGGRIAALLDAGTDAPARQTIDVNGQYVVPGLIDMHVHAFEGVIHFGVDIDALCLARGVTTALDLGSCGGLMLDGLRRYVLDVCRTRLFTLCHISAKGMLGSLHDMPHLGDLDDLRYVDPEFCARTVEQHRDKVLGVKVRLTDVLAEGGKHELPGLLRAREAADAANVPLVVHMPDSTLPLDRILQEMRPGDMLTHVFHGRRCGTLTPEGAVWPRLRELVAGGLWLDVGHGVGSFCWKTARRALGEGLLPHFISSDMHQYNIHGPVFDLVTTMDKFLHLGMSLDEVVERATLLPARFLHLEDEIGTLRPGAAADVTVLQVIEGEFPLTDTMGVTEIGTRHLEPRVVLLAGQPVGVLPRG
ncbi:MAG: amidohydrolase family protein [Pirellulales bacterium]